MSIATPETARPRRGRLYIVVGAILAVLAFATAAGLASLSLFQQTAAGTKVVEAKTNISARTKIQASDLQLTAFSPAPPQSFTDMGLVAGKGARVDIPAGSPITANLIVGSGDLLSSGDIQYLPIPSGYVAVTIPTGELLGVGGYPQVGDRITMLATLNTSVFGPGVGANVVRTVFRDLVIIRVGPVGQTSSTGQVTSSLTLLVTSCDAEYLFWVLNNASMKYTLESFKDYAAAPSQPDPTCTKPGGVGPKDVNKRWQFTGP
jgi:Flp pilus assembly protein CpaB